jgi:hypothetical protein
VRKEITVKRIVTVLLMAAFIGVSAVAPASADSDAQDAAYGAGSVFSTLVYAPVKGAVCILGGVSAGFSLPFAGPDTAGKIAGRACGGTWAITPSVLKGKEPVRFVGGNGSAPSSRTAARR